MAGASYVQSSFLGGLVSKWTQGRYHDQHYRTWLETCLNGFPVETESWVRRPGFGLAGATRGGSPARLIKFDFEATAPYTMEFTDGHLRFFQASELATTNDGVVVSSISAANPAVVTLATAVTWATGDQAFFTGLTGNPLLENRPVALTKISTTTFSLADAITGAAINGASLAALTGTVILNRILDIATVYTSGAWANLRSVQSETTAFFLHPQFPPYALTVNTEPSGSTFATFGLNPANFKDGPYLDPLTNGLQVTPNQLTGIVQLSLSFPAWVATTAYVKGAFVTSSSVNYVSLVDQNVGNTPVSSPSQWAPTTPAAALNNGQGFLGSDIGRLVRLFSEPAAWVSGTSYSQGNVVSYNPSGLPGGNVYYSSLTNTNSGHTPGTDTTNWQLVALGSAQNPAIWTWGKITSLVNFIPGAPAGIAHIGDMTANGGLAAAFDNVTNQNKAASAVKNLTPQPVGTPMTAFVGQNYGGASPSSYKIQSATVFPATDAGFISYNDGFVSQLEYTAYLYASNSPPASYNNGTLLGSTFIGHSATPPNPAQPSTLLPVTITSNDQTTSYQYVWVAIVALMDFGFTGAISNLSANVAQVEFVSATTASSSNGVNVQLLGSALLYTNPITTWRLGLYSGTTGYPTCGTYAEGRLWLSGAAPNRIDACVANGIGGVNDALPVGSVNFAPTDQYGNVTDANAIDYTFNAPDTNPILWMIPDLQGVLCGTKAGEWIVQAPTSGGISPTNIVARRMTVIGCANIEPRRTEHTIVFVQRYLRKIVEYFADVFSGKFTAPNLSKDAKQLTIGNIQEIAYQQELAPIVWARVNNGLIGTTYKRDTLMTSSGPTINGWHEHTLGSGRQVESIVVGSSVNGTLDALMVVTNDINTNVRFVEVLSPILDEATPQAAAQYLDAAIVPSSTSAIAVSKPNFPYGGLQLNGLWPLNGYTVTAWLGGLDLGDYAVSNGSIQVPYGDGIGNGTGAFPASSGANRNDEGLFTATFVSTGVTANGVTLWTGTMPMLVGFTYTSQGRIVRPSAPAESGARSGPGFAKKRRSQWIMAQFEGSQGVSWGTQFDSTLQTVRFTQPNGQAYTVDQQFSGIVRDNPQANYDFDNMLCWQVTRPYICNVQAIGAALETQDI